MMTLIFIAVLFFIRFKFLSDSFSFR